MTANLLNGETTSIELYENPAQQVLPGIVRDGASLLALGLSAGAETLAEPLREIYEMIRNDDFPAESVVGRIASTSVQRLRGVRTYLFPPLVRFKMVDAAEFVLVTNAPAPAPRDFSSP
jgi:hypothetical protein